MAKILIEAVGSYTSGYLIESIQKAGHHCVASDINPYSAGALLADSFLTFPPINDDKLWSTIETLLVDHNVDVVIPTFDEMLLGWAERKEYFSKLGITVITSDLSVHQVFIDKWLTFKAFQEIDVPIAESSLSSLYPLIKPRVGRGSVGIRILEQEDIATFTLPGNFISQKVLAGQEYTVDCLFSREGKLHYCIPRKRLAVKEGKSTGGIVDKRKDIIDLIEKVSQHYCFQGPVNMQCFVNNNEVTFIEINARFGGGSSLGLAASENWIPLLMENFVHHKALPKAKPIKNNLAMYRQYRDVFDDY